MSRYSADAPICFAYNEAVRLRKTLTHPARLWHRVLCHRHPGKDLNKDIGRLVEKGLPDKIQQALDSVRVIGNESVHPGLIDLNDTPETANTLFLLINLIVEQLITHPKKVETIYETLPKGKLEGIEKRDAKK